MEGLVPKYPVPTGGIVSTDVSYASVDIISPKAPTKHNHYFKDVSKLKTIDVYRVISLFNVTDPCIQHAIKKLLVAGGRGAGKDVGKDIQEAVDSLVRYQDMAKEDSSE